MFTAKNCLTCEWRGEARTPACSKKPEWAATCEYPLPSISMIEFNDTDVRRHLNLATILPESPHYNANHAAQDCRTWAADPARTAEGERLREAAKDMRRSARELRDNANGDPSVVQQAIYWEGRADAIDAALSKEGRYEELVARLRLHRSWRDSHGELNDAPVEAATAISTLEAEIAELVEGLAELAKAVDGESYLKLCDIYLKEAMHRARSLLSKHEEDRS